MGIRITFTDTNTAEDGYNVYRSTASMAGLEDSALPAPIAELPAGATGFDDGTVTDGETYFYIVAAVSGDTLARAAEVEVMAAETGSGGADFTNAQIGDEIGGGIYAGINTIGGTDYYIIAGNAASEVETRWKNSRTATAGTDSNSDGLANTNAMVAAGIANHPAAQHCLNYDGGGHNDWHMPARNQVTLMYQNLAGHPEFDANKSSSDYTWASTERSDIYAWSRRFSDGYESESNNNGFKDDAGRRVRPVRRIAV